MCESVKRHADLLRALQKATPLIRKSILKSADKGLIHSICTCAENTLKGRVHLNHCQKSKLRRHKKILRKIVRSGETWKAKKRILVQSGGTILPLLIAPLLGSILGNIFK